MTVQDGILLQERSEPKITSHIPSEVSSEDLPSDSDIFIQDENSLPEPKLVSGSHLRVSPSLSEDARDIFSVSTDRCMSDSVSGNVNKSATSTYGVLGAPEGSQICMAKYKFADNVSIVSEFEQLKLGQFLSHKGIWEYRRSFSLVVDITEPTGPVRPKSDSFVRRKSDSLAQIVL